MSKLVRRISIQCFIAAILVVGLVGCDDDYWGKNYVSAEGEYARTLTLTGTSGAITTGLYDEDIYIRKIDGDGNVEWEKSYAGPERDGFNQGPTIIQATGGGYLCMANTHSWFTGTGSYHIWLIKIDSSGNIVWEKAFTNYGSNANGSDIIKTLDGGYIVLGQKYSIKVNSNGNLVWQKNIAGYSIVSVTGGYIIANRKYDAPAGNHENQIYKIDENGSILWAKKYSYGSDYFFFSPSDSLCKTSDGNLAVVGWTTTPVWKSMILKVDMSGDLIWSKAINTTENEMKPLVVESASSNGVIVGGGYGWTEGFILRFNSSGNLLWQRSYSEGIQAVFDISTFADGFILSGWSFNSDVVNSAIITVDEDGLLPNSSIAYRNTTNTISSLTPTVETITINVENETVYSVSTSAAVNAFTSSIIEF